MKRDARMQQRLAEFGALTLQVLEAHEEWDSDTVGQIGADALYLRLANNRGKHGLFQRSKAVQRYMHRRRS